MVATKKVLVFCLSMSLWATHAHAFEYEIKVDGQVVPPILFDGFVEHQLSRHMRCSPHSDSYVRDRVVLHWLTKLDGEARKLPIAERTQEYLDKFDAELASDQAKTDEEFVSTRRWLKLEFLAGNYRSQQIKSTTDEQKMAEYERLVNEKDPAFVNVPFVQIARMQTGNIDRLEAIATKLRDGQSWEQVSADIDEYDWNSHNYERWLPASHLGNTSNNLIKRLNIDINSLATGDVLGPFEEHPVYQLVVILNHDVVAQVQANAEIVNTDDWAFKEAGYSLVKQQHIAINTALLEGRELTENGQPFIPRKDGYFEGCPVE